MVGKDEASSDGGEVDAESETDAAEEVVPVDVATAAADKPHDTVAHGNDVHRAFDAEAIACDPIVIMTRIAAAETNPKI